MSVGVMIVTRAAASSTARGMPSSRRQISATAAALTSSSTNVGCTARARSTNSCTAGLEAMASTVDVCTGSSSALRGHTCSPATPSASRIVARIWRTPGQSRRRPSASPPTGSTRCSQLSSTRTSSRVRSASRMLAVSDVAGRGNTPSVVATTCASSSSSRAVASSHSHAPSWKRDAMSRATWIAMRLFPTPPTPVTVTNRDARSASPIASRSTARPTSDVSCPGRLPGIASSDRNGGNSRTSPVATTWKIRSGRARSGRRCSPRSRSATWSGSESRTISSVACDTTTWAP